MVQDDISLAEDYRCSFVFSMSISPSPASCAFPSPGSESGISTNEAVDDSSAAFGSDPSPVPSAVSGTVEKGW